VYAGEHNFTVDPNDIYSHLTQVYTILISHETYVTVYIAIAILE